MLGCSPVTSPPGTLGLDLSFLETQNLSAVWTLNSPWSNRWWVPVGSGKGLGLWQLLSSDRALPGETEDWEVRRTAGCLPSSSWYWKVPWEVPLSIHKVGYYVLIYKMEVNNSECKNPDWFSVSWLQSNYKGKHWKLICCFPLGGYQFPFRPLCQAGCLWIWF